jgi:hypothetical protein
MGFVTGAVGRSRGKAGVEAADHHVAISKSRFLKLSKAFSNLGSGDLLQIYLYF